MEEAAATASLPFTCPRCAEVYQQGDLQILRQDAVLLPGSDSLGPDGYPIVTRGIVGDVDYAAAPVYSSDEEGEALPRRSPRNRTPADTPADTPVGIEAGNSALLSPRGNSTGRSRARANRSPTRKPDWA